MYIALARVHTHINEKARTLHERAQSGRIDFFITTLLFVIYFIAGMYFLYRARIQKEKALNRELLNSQKRFKHLLDCAPNAVIIATEDGNILDTSAEASKLFGYT